ncbi:obscurin-like isoform X6 [Microplitis mediator]|uniref:obscurin-like isoform X6 n=1 Tax=Microplitis mediator TaxID=375433 RepID=UPI0025575BF3|nr:obscurin-like isoform X6 [Microplitis mediator]
MSFCRITGRSRGLPKPNYFPLLPPISPADAKRFCRITGKSYGLPTHHYIPVLLGVHKTDKSKCRVTNNNSGAHHQYTAGFILAGEKRKHVILKDYRYVFPVLEGDGEQQKALRELLRTKEPLGDGEENLKFVYTVNERRCSLVFPAQLEAAVRDGDVKDVMLSRDCDTVLLRLKQGKNVSVDFKDFGGDDLEHLYDGLGPREDVLKEQERLEANARKRKKKRANGLNYAKKIFEDKEKAADEAEEQDSKKMKLNIIKEEFKEEIISWKNVDLDHARVGRSQLTAISNQESLNYSITTSCNWESLTSNAGVIGTPIVDKLPTPVQIEAATIDIESTAIGVVTSPISEETGGLEAISIIKPLTPLNVEPDPAIYEALVNLTAEELEETADVKEKFLNAGKEALEALPTVEEISKLVENVEKGKKHEINKVKGLKIDIESAQRFVTGKTVQTPNGPVFVPGQTLQTPKGQTFVPGFTVHTPSGPVLIPGQIVSVTEENKQMPVFIAGQTLETKSGVKFVQGQTMHTSEGAKFVTGQTVFTEEGPKFVAGHAVTQDKFVAGQTVVTEKGAQFMPGQTITNEHGEHIFVPGQSVKNNQVWRFVPGQCLSCSIGEPVFVPGKTMQTSEGLRFVAGQSVITESGKEQFVPGMTMESKEGPTFVPGTTLDTPQGPKFVQGMVMKTPEGERFVPGTTVVGAGDSFEFAAAKSVKDITFLEAGPVGIPVDPKTANTVSSLEQQEIFGHMVQTEHGVEFIPESKKIPEGKRIVPGQLVRGGKDGPRFVPGMMTEEGFLPGQIVITEKGDQFIPGQVVETSTGPKFVPGRMVETRTGPKFVPGQTMETTDGPRFVPGQIVQTKVGPTFIPGQVITTENKGSRFVPGQVVDTPDGPRFVPGRVVESGELGVTFVPGQIVQTEEGPRFVAPDLMDTPEGEMEFSVQGFEVTPEELALLRPDHLHYNATSKQHHEPMSIDARMLKQLSEAGMSVGRKISAVVPNVNVDVDPTAIALENALVIAKKLGLKGDSAVKMAQIVSTVSQLANNIVNEYQNNEKPNFESLCNGHNSKSLTNGSSHQNGHTEDDDWLHEAVKGAIATAILAITDIDDQTPTNGDKSYVLSSISEAFNVFLRQGSSSIEQSVDQVLKILMVPQSRTALCQTAVIDLLESTSNKVDLLKSTIVRHSLKSDIVLERLSAVLEEEHGSDLVGSAFRAVSKDDPELVLRVLEKVSQEVAGVATDREAAETVHKAIVQAVRESSELHVKELLLNDNYDGNNNSNSNLRELILQAVGLARALGMSTTASSLLAVISDEKSTKLLANDRVTLDILKRLTVMRKLAEARPQFIAALRDLTSDPEMARSDPHLRTLVRESAALMIVPEDAPLQSSVDVPTALLNAENSLAIEDFLMRKSHRPSTIFMILKHGLQAVVPREAAHAVLTGQVAYTVLDENGITHFEPLHVFNALRLNKPTAHRFSMYACPVAGDDDFEMELITPYGNNNNGNAYGTADSVSSYDACSSTNGRYYSSQDYSSGVTLTRSDRTIENSVSRENTPCFRRLSCLHLDDRGTADNFIVVKDYVSEEDNGFAVKIGDIVEAIEFNDDLTKRKKMDPDLEIGEVGACLDNSAARHKLSVRPKRRHVDPRSRVITRSNSDSNIRALVKKIDGQQGWLPMSILMQTALSEDSSTLTSHRPEDSQYRREAVVKELVETEEEFGRDLQQVVERYLKPLDNPGVPRAVRDNKEIIFTNFKQIADFHNTSFGRVLIEGVKYYADQPRMLGKTFLRLERDFDKHVAYCRDEPAAQEFLQTSLEVRDYFEELSQTLGDDKSVSEHLKLPIQRINDYQLLLKELVKYSTRLGENCDDLQKALELMLGIPHRATDNKFISNIEGYKGNIHKLGRLLTHEWFTVVDKDGKSKERYLFLFKARILVCKVRRISEDRSVFVLKDIIKLPEVEVKDYPDDQRTFELHNPSGATGYPLTLIAHKDLVKAYWLKEIRQYSSDLLALAEHAADDLQLSEEKDTEDSKVRKLEGTKIDLPPQAKKYQETPTKIPVRVEPAKPQAPLQTSSQASLPTLPQASSAPPAAEAKTAEKRESLTKVEELEAKKVKTEESHDMSKYSSSHFSASSKVVEEYSSVSSSRNGSSSYVETSSSSLARAERRASSSLYSSDKITESSGSYETAIGGSSETKTSKLAVTAAESVKPKFVKTIEGISAEPIHAKQAIIHVIAGESATFECTLESSSESCRMHWLKDNKPLDDKIADRVKITSTDKLFKLEITNVSASDSGIYTARAANGEGNATCTAQLVVESLTAEERKAKAEAKAPVFLVRLKDTELLENTYLRFMIKVKGDPTPDVKFYKDGKLIDATNNRVKIQTDEDKYKSDKGFYELVIPDVQKQDAGTYSCTATNKFGEATCEATVSVTDEKTLFAGLPEGVFEAGTETQFRWLRDGKPFNPEDRFKVLFEDNEDTLALVFQHVKPEDAGLYTCVAQTSTGNISCSAELTVQGNVKQLMKDPCKPALGSESRQSEVSAGGSAMLDLQVKGFPKPDIKWTKDGKEIVAGGRIKYLWEDEESVSLVIKNVTVEDAGTYTVRAKNELGEDTTYIELIVKSAPKFIKKQTDTFAYIETEGKMTVQIQASPAPEVKWYKDGQILEASDRLSMTRDGDHYSLIIKECRLDDIGSYSVVAKNEINQTSEFWNFDVRCPPKIKKKLGEPKVIDEGDTLTLLIEVENTPEPTVVWLKDEVVIKEDQRIQIINEGPRRGLKITGTVDIDAATYKAEVSNKDGTTVDQVGVEVRSAPRFKKEMTDVIAREGDAEVEISVEVAGYPRPSLQWYINDMEITEDKTEFSKSQEGDVHTLKITDVKTEHAGRYTCRLKNQYGKKESKANLTVYCRPKLLKKLADQKLNEGATLKLQVQVAGTPTPDVKWFKDGKEVSADARIIITRDSKRQENYDLTVNLLKGSDGGVYEVRATNEMGYVSSKSKVIILTKTEETVEKKEEEKAEEDVEEPQGPEAAPSIVSSDFEDCTVFATQNKTFTVHGTGLPRPDAKWFKDGNPIRSADKAKPGHTGEKFTLSFTKLTENETALYQLVLSNKLGTISVDAYIEVAPESELRKPRFTEPLKDIDAEKNGAGTFQCVLTADPIPDIIWSYEGVDLSPENDKYKMERSTKKVDDALIECTYNLTVSDCTLEDVGKYTLRAENKWGDDSSNARLELLVPPEILEFKELNAAVEELSKWEVIIKSNPRAELTWEKDGIILDDENRFAAEDNYRDMKYYLVLKCVEYDDAGVYKVTAKNYLGEDTAEAELVPYTEPPEFLLEITNGSVRHDAAIEFKIEAKGIARPKIQWLLNGDEIIPDERHIITTTTDGHVYSRLRFEHFQQSDEGELTCVATNRAGKAKSKCTVSMIRLPPTFAELLPRSQQIEEGAPLVFNIEVDGSPFPKVTWFKDGEEIKPDDHVKIETQPNGSTKLTIEKCTPTDSGAYKIIAKNNNGESTSQCAVAIKPTPRKPSFSKPLEDVTVTVGQPLKLEAQVVAFPSPEVQWFKDGLPVRQSPDIEFINEPNGLMGISIDKVKPENAGTYSLVVKNKLGEVTGKAVVTVEAKEKKPEFLSTLQPMTVVEGFPAKMEVKIVGKPLPLIAWTYNGVEIIPDGTHIKIVSQPDGTQALLIDKVTVDDAGEYGVAALNTVGEEECKGILNVSSKSKSDAPEEKPCFLGPLRDTSIEEGEPLTFSASFAGNPMPDVFWTKDGEPIEPSDRILMTCDGKKVGLEINPTTAKDAGVYRCRLVNPSGEDTSNAIATVRKVFQRPNFTQKFTDLQQVPGNDAKFAARITGIPRPDVSWYFNDKPIPKDADKYIIKRDGDACSLFVKDCSPSDAGKYKCRAINKDGDASCEALLTVADKIDKQQKVEPPSFLKRIGDCEVYKGMTAKFTACATGIPDPSFEWYRNDERLWPTDRIRMDEEGSGLLRLTILNVEEHDVGKYSLRIINPHGEDTCHAEMRYETLEPRTKKPLADQYSEFDKYRKSGIPLPLADRPIISRMMDRHLTLSWKPSIPIGPRVPVTYLVEMCEQPDGDWFTARSGIRSCVCDIRNLEPFRDYKFRIRVENKYGISDPSPFAQTYRSKLLPDPPKFHPYLPPGIDFRPETSPYFPKDFDIERPPHDGYAQIPKFLRQEHDTQYGVKNHNCNLFWFVYGYPKPKMTYYFNNELIESGGRYDQSYTRNGQATLFINKMLERDVGMYEAIATNEHGEARQRVRLEIAEYPTFIQRPEESYVMLRRNGHIQARVTGVPFPELKWYKDWKPLTSTARVKIDFFDPDTSVLTINDAIVKDEGLYSISARNVAGSVSCSVMVHIEENEHEYGYRTYTRNTDVKTKVKPFDEFYDLGDELGRGTQGVTYHAVERSTGRNFAAKLMHGRGELKPIMLSEMNAMNHLNHRKLIRLHDAYETDGSLNLVMELAAGGELVDTLTRQPFYNEYEISNYIRQILQGLEYMHNESWAHLSLTLGDLLISHSGGDSLKITDFGLARRISYGRLMTLVYGMPEYVAPEVVNEEGVTYAADMWSLGIITHILLSGISPFRGANDRETLTKIKNGTWDFDERWWQNISTEARDFIRCLLVYKVDDRMDVTAALRHPWLNMTDRVPAEPYKIPSENLKNYYTLFRDWYGNASCRTWYRRRKLSSAFEHPSRMVYPPGHRYTPEPEERPFTPTKRDKPEPRTWENKVPSRVPIDTEIGIIKNESHYQNGPDTYLLQLRDTDFPVRLREYMKVAHNRGSAFARVFDDEGYDWRTPIIRERRRFTDVMDEEIDDERKARINNYGAADCHTMRRLRHELGTRLDSYAEAEAMMETKKGGHLPFLREKPQMLQIQCGKCAQLTCLAVGNPKPAVQWFKNDLVIQEGKRISIIEDTDGRSILSFNPAREIDIGIYKVVARNNVGQTVARTRVVLATEPGLPQAPEVCNVSDTEVLLRWKPPKDDGNSEVLCYNLQYKAGDSVDWIDVASNIDHEFYLVKDLQPNTSYHFRLAARNRIGWSEKGFETNLIQTKPEGAPKIPISRAMKHLQYLTESGHEIVPNEDKPKLNYDIEDEPIEWTIDAQFTGRYTFISEVYRGQFSMVVKGAEKESDKLVVAKILEASQDRKEFVGEEFQVLRSLRHERIALLEAAYWAADSPVAVFIMEKLQGSDVLTYLASRPEYTENCVATIITEVLDALQYLHWRGYCHLDIQPDNIVMASLRSAHIKLVDFGSAHKVSKLGTEVPQNLGHLEYRSPEVLNEELAYPQTDIWSVAVLTYVLLSGASPFKGNDEHETRQNISFVRYRFEYLYKEISQEATRFLMLLFKRTPSKRPTAEECHEHRWATPTEFMIKKRERASFPGSRLKAYNEEYHEEKAKLASRNDNLMMAFGNIRQLNRSYSTQDELITSIDNIQ